MIAYGHSDRSARLGVQLQLEHPTFKAAVRRIVEACDVSTYLDGQKARACRAQARCSSSAFRAHNGQMSLVHTKLTAMQSLITM